VVAVSGSKAKATLWLEGAWIKVRTPYVPSFVADLKAIIPRGQRKWDPDEKVWCVDPAYDEDLIALCERMFDRVEVVEVEPEVVEVPVAVSGTDPAGEMIRLCPDATLQKVYRVIAASLHPDAPDGDASKFVLLGQAFEQLKKDRGI